MDYIVVMFHPFEIKQEVKIYQHGQCIDELYPCLDDTTKAIYTLSQEYHTDKIELCGNPSFVSKYVRELKSNFSEMPEIEIISK